MNKHTHSKRTNTLERRAANGASFSSFAFAVGIEVFFSLSTTQYTTIVGFTPGTDGEGGGAKEIDIPISERKFFLVVDMLFFSPSLLIALCTKFTHYYFLAFFDVFRFSLRSAEMGLIAVGVVFVVFCLCLSQYALQTEMLSTHFLALWGGSLTLIRK